jgi:hypothetical protein
MNRVYVRPIQPDEATTFFSWAVENADKSEFDPAVALFPSSSTWCAYDKTGPLAYQTLQQPIMLESLAPRPGLSPVQISLCLKELTKNAITQGSIKGAGEIYFLGMDEDTNQFAENHIFEEVNMKIFRLKLADLEGKDADNHEG